MTTGLFANYCLEETVPRTSLVSNATKQGLSQRHENRRQGDTQKNGVRAEDGVTTLQATEHLQSGCGQKAVFLDRDGVITSIPDGLAVART